MIANLEKRSESKPMLNRMVMRAFVIATALAGLGYGIASIWGSDFPLLSIVSFVGLFAGLQFLVGVVLPVLLVARRGNPDRRPPIRLLLTNIYFLALILGVLLGLR